MCEAIVLTVRVDAHASVHREVPIEEAVTVALRHIAWLFESIATGKLGLCICGF